MRVAGVFNEFVATLIESLDEDCAELNALRDHRSPDNGQIAEVAHKLLGAARLVHADLLAEACRRLAASGDIDDMDAVVQAATDLIGVLQQSLSLADTRTTEG